LPHATNAQGREARRRYVLKRVAELDVPSLPLGVQQLLCAPAGALSTDERRRVVRALVARGLDARRCGLVLNVIGDRPASDHELADLLQAAHAERARALRLTENFSVVAIAERGGSRGPFKEHTRFMLRIRLDEDGRELTLDLGEGELATYGRFRKACVRQGRFVPLFRADVAARTRGQAHFDRFVNTLLAPLRAQCAEHTQDLGKTTPGLAP
jgi:hypothetical protein